MAVRFVRSRMVTVIDRPAGQVVTLAVQGQTWSHASPSVTRFPTEEPQRDQQGTQAPQTDDEHITPVKHRAHETCLYPVGEVLHREDARDPGDPYRCVVPDGDEDA